MKTFGEWQKEKVNEGLGKNLAIGAALAGGALGLNKFNKTPVANPQTQQQMVQQAAQDVFAPSEKAWNSELGDFRTLKQPDGTIVYRTANGDFKQVDSPVGPKFVRIR